MTRTTFTINGDADRDRVAEFVRSLKDGMRVEIKHPKRTDPQNAKFWAMLGEIADQVKWHGLTLTEDDWKLIFMDALKREVRVVPNIDGNGFVNLGQSSSDLSVSEMSDAIELMLMFGANHGVTFKESNSRDGNPANFSDRADTTPAGRPPVPSPLQSAGVFSFKSADWLDRYVECLTAARETPASLLTRHQDAIKRAVDSPNKSGDQDIIMQAAVKLVKARNEMALRKGEWDERMDKLRRQAAATIKVTA